MWPPLVPAETCESMDSQVSPSRGKISEQSQKVSWIWIQQPKSGREASYIWKFGADVMAVRIGVRAVRTARRPLTAYMTGVRRGTWVWCKEGLITTWRSLLNLSLIISRFLQNWLYTIAIDLNLKQRVAARRDALLFHMPLTLWLNWFPNSYLGDLRQSILFQKEIRPNYYSRLQNRLRPLSLKKIVTSRTALKTNQNHLLSFKT